ncbi:hypothetical protein [Cupriavidus sp. YAF13]|uniref:hypothetical protein n=1 Tax=Cupriavidus sp. YAF13 TaxID=3233075 RepID=UPI003F8ED430
MKRNMSRWEVRRIVLNVIVDGPFERRQFEDLVEFAWMTVLGPIGLWACVIRWAYRLARLIAVPVAFPATVFYFRRKRVKQIKANRAARIARPQ